MTTEISVGPPVLTINQGDTFMVTDLNGEISAGSEQGIFSQDTRFLSYYSIYANGDRWLRLSSSTTSYFASQIHLTNDTIPTEYGEISKGTLALTITRQVGGVIREHLSVTNYGLSKAVFNLEIALRSDFADIFEVRWHKFVRRGRIDTTWERNRGELRVSYRNHEFQRCFIYRILESNSKAHFANGRIVFELSLESGQTWECTSLYLLRHREGPAADDIDWKKQAIELDSLQQLWHKQATKLNSANEEIYRTYSKSVDDMGALRLYTHDLASDVWVPAAGVPWYVGLFGRDSLIASLQNMFINARFAIGALETLSELQAKEVNDWQDAQPGKILHEVRKGELAYLKRIPHLPYYGSADSTPLFLTVVHEAWKWLGHEWILRNYRDACLRCLEWIDKYGDLDGDGFQEYETRSSQGYENMCWKDSRDGILYPNGSNVDQPKAVCELQGYVFDAWLRMGEVFDALDESRTAAELRQKAQRLQRQFETAFWSDELEFYALALDNNKHQVLSVASNAGHLLWSGIAGAQHAGKVVKRLMQPDMWSGWGIRTLSAEHHAYNPHSYHCGSVWPHDNGLIALGFKRYGYIDEAASVARDISRAASYFVGNRIPELYAGIERQQDGFPVQYLGANVPQAWAAGSIFHLLQAITGLQANAPRHELFVDPHLPRWLPDLHLSGISVGDSVVDLHFKRDGDNTSWDADVKEGALDVLQNSWRPWLSALLVALLSAALLCQVSLAAESTNVSRTGLKIPDMVQEDSVSTFIPSPAALGCGIAVNVIYSSVARYKEGAPVVVVVPGGWSSCGLDFNMHAAQAGFVEVRFAFPGGGSGEFVSGGTYDMRGPKSQTALRDVLRFAAGQIADTRGRTIDQLLSMGIYNKTIVLVGWENGGNIATITLAKYANSLPFVGCLAYYESPIGQAFIPPNLGSTSDLMLNSHYRQGSCATGHCLIDFRKLTYCNDAQKEPGMHRKYGEPEIHGVLFFDENNDKVWEEPIEYALSYLAVPEVAKQIYPPYVLSAVIRYRVFGKQWPKNVATLPESEAYYRQRDGSLYIKDLVNSLPDCMISIFGRVVDQVQGQPDHPHTTFLYNAFLANRANWLRLNPDPVYAGQVAWMNTHNFVDNKINDSIDASEIESYLEPEGLTPDFIYMVASIAEMSDRKKTKRMFDTLTAPIVDYGNKLNPSAPSPLPAKPASKGK